MRLRKWRIAAAILLTILSVFGLAFPFGGGHSSADKPESVTGASFDQYPPALLPAWVKYQWLSWYAVGMAMNEDYLKAQIDFIANNLADLGPWHILVDAGWYVSEGRPGSDWRNVDDVKFPSGLRGLVDYAHARGVRVVLYISVPYLNDKSVSGNWLGMGDIIQNHPDWLIPLGASDGGNGYLYNFNNPDVRAYMTEVLRDYFVKYDVDGIKVDGFGDAEREVQKAVQRGVLSQANKPSLQETAIYQFIYQTATSFKPDAYVEGGWNPPIDARPFIHTVRYGDEYPAFNYAYPTPGLRQHIDYSLVQRGQLGERPNIGAIWGDPNDVSVGYQWLEAGLALSSQVVLGFDLPSMNPQVLDGYRARLSQYNAFQSEPIVGGNGPDTFASRTNGTTYIGVINRDNNRKVATVDLSKYGLNPNGSYLVYDVISDSFFRTSSTLTFEVPPQRFRLFLLRNEIGVMWTNGSFQQGYVPGQLRIVFNGPASLLGYADIHTPAFSAVYLDGRQLAADQYRFDGVNNVLTLTFDYSGPREVKIVY